MKAKITLLFFLIIFCCSVGLNAQTVLYNFEDGTTQAGTYAMNWGDAPYLKAFDVIANPATSSINTTAKTLRIQEESNPNWWDNMVTFTFTTPVTITSANRYLHIMHRRPRLDGGGFVVNINANSMLGDPDKGKTRFDANLSAVNTWQDIVIDLNDLITNTVQLSKFCINPDLNNWGNSGLPLGDYYFDEIILSNSPLPRGTTFLTGNNLYDFEAGTAANISGIGTSANTDNPVTYPVANPMNNAKNTTANVGKRSVIANAQWWTGFSFSFANPVQIDADHKYLHILVSVPVDGQKIALDVKQGATNVIADGVSTVTTANVWQDVVYDVSGLAYISGLSLKLGHWDGSAVGDYYFDEIRIDGSATPRTAVTTALQNPTSSMKIYATNKNINIENAGVGNQVNIYSVNGQNIISKQIQNSEIFTVNHAGLYFVKVGDQTTKVLVK